MSELEDRRRQREVIELITFPSSKNFPKEARDPAPKSYGDDPLEDLLHEFDDFEDMIDIGTELLDPEELLEWLGFDPTLLHSEESDLDPLIHDQLELLMEIGHRLKYYLDEIEQVLPTK
jgi:hypothetical protein